MKKKFIDIETYKNIEKNSLTAVERELQEAAELVGGMLGDTNLEVFCIDESTVTFINSDGNYVQANYEMNKDQILLENIEELIVEANHLASVRKEIIGKMVDNILGEKNEVANNDFSDYFNLPVVRAGLKEGIIAEAKKHEDEEDDNEGGKKKKKGKKKLPPALQAYLDKKHGKNKDGKSKKAKKKAKKDSLDKKRLKKVAKDVENKKGEEKLEEWKNIAKNILEFVDFRTNGEVHQSAKYEADTKGNITKMAVPRTHLRNEGKILMLHYKDMANVMGCRMDALKEEYDSQSNWVRAINDLKRLNSMSDHNGLETAVENVVTVWPNLLYLTRDEIASKINETLTISGAKNFDDDTCAFLADGISRTAHRVYSDKVSKIFNVAGKTPELDDYDQFSVVAETVFKRVDQDATAELQVFKDLYRSISEINQTSRAMGDDATRFETQSLLKVCENVLSHKTRANLDVAEDFALYLETLVESAEFEGSGWSLVQPHLSAVGDNPFIHKYATENGSPGAHKGPFERSPMSDGKSVKVNVEDYYTGMKGSEMGANLSNPYAPKPGDFKMHGEKSVGEEGDDLATFQDGDTWPNLKNPYLPDRGMSMADSTKLLDGKY
jgi:hypothetical protein